MEIKTKYGIGDTVFFMFENMIEKGKIEKVKANVNGCFDEPKTTIKYTIALQSIYEPKRHKYDEDDVFSTVDEVIEYLKDPCGEKEEGNEI
jgi:hypothetical protein